MSDDIGIFPFVPTQDVEDVDTDNEELPLYREYAYDFDNNRLLTGPDGNTYLVEGNEALRIWIYKALRTPRYAHAAYDDDYGCELDNLIGEPMSSDVTHLEIKRYITEALMVNPYIDELSDFQFASTRSGVEVSFCVRTGYGTDTITVNEEGTVYAL
nr:MAG TPA: Protein of unknown function (DUF2634) [Caudoviricetes sp.]